MNKFLFASFFVCFSLTFGFSSEKADLNKKTSFKEVSFVSLFDNHSVSLYAKKSKKSDGDGFESFVKKIAPYEKTFLYAAIATTVCFGVFTITGIILMSAGYWIWRLSTTLVETLTGNYVRYAGSALFGFSWLFFLAAAATWVFWGFIQYGRKKGYVMNVFSTADSIGISIKL
ncbi:MAG TPA: hypothetical protein PLO89_01085 [Spirochaetota bacterium]|nr:hypothetical protein [Spirochaetota bacterium]